MKVWEDYFSGLFFCFGKFFASFYSHLIYNFYTYIANICLVNMHLHYSMSTRMKGNEGAIDLIEM